MPNRNSYQRIDRISEEVRREVDRIIRDELNDPRISGTFSITRAEVTRDLRYAKIFVSVLEENKREGLMDALKNASGFIRHALAKEMIIRQSPELIFTEDRNIAYGAHIAQVLREVYVPETEAETEDGEESGDA
ncbi:MAG: 30S ribosome-binding factor RbfA [Clostridia bacterium]|nr:30S ribosome-binding factor RbfA [Clostridia bacterium]